MRTGAALLLLLAAEVGISFAIMNGCPTAPEGQVKENRAVDQGAYLPPKGYVCDRASGPIVMDGRLDDAAWVQVPCTDLFVDIEGDAQSRPRFRTRAKMLWDDQYFYVG